MTFTLNATWLLFFTVPPLLFLIWNHWCLSKHTNTILKKWKRKEAEIIKDWSLQEIDDVEEELNGYLKKDLQSPSYFFLLVLLNLLVFPLTTYYFNWGVAPVLIWIPSFILVYFQLKTKAETLLNEGIAFHRVATHKRIQQELRVVTEYKDGIVLPYLFLKSYQRSLMIQEEISKAIRESISAEQGKREIYRLNEEDKELLKDMNHAIMGRMPKRYSTEVTETEEVDFMPKRLPRFH